MLLTTCKFLFLDGTGEINQAGVDHYNKLINALLDKGIPCIDGILVLQILIKV